MKTASRFPYAAPEAGSFDGSLLPHLPITLSRETYVLAASGLLDTGSAVNVLPYATGHQLGLSWEEQTTPVRLTGNIERLPARGVIVTGRVATFPPVELAFAWTRSTEVSVILGQVNFFMEFDVCFFRSRSAFEVSPKDKAGTM